MNPNLNIPGIVPGKLTEADFAPAPAEACSELGADWPTTRRYHRTASDAFRGAEYASALVRFADRFDRRPWLPFIGVAVVAFLCFVLVAWLRAR